jgi:hypothetical protein
MWKIFQSVYAQISTPAEIGESFRKFAYLEYRKKIPH